MHTETTRVDLPIQRQWVTVAGGLFAVAHVTLDRAPAVCRRCPRQSARVRCARGRRVADATKFIRVDRGVIETAVRGLLQFHRAVDGGRERQWPRCQISCGVDLEVFEKAERVIAEEVGALVFGRKGRAGIERTAECRGAGAVVWPPRE